VNTSYKRIVALTTPVALGQLSYTAMGIADTVMVGQLGVTALAGVGLGNIIAWWVLSLFWGMLAGVNTLVAQAVGARDPRAAGVALWQGLYLGGACTVMMLAVWPLAPTIFAWTGVSPEIEAIATRYMRIRLIGGLGLTTLMVADNFYRGIGRTDIPMWCGFIKLFINCGFNYIFIFGAFGAPRLGTDGAAVGTVIANISIGALMASLLFVRSEFRMPYRLRDTWRFQPVAFRALVRVSWPIGVQTFMEMGGISVFTAAVGRLGDAQLAATNAVIQMWSVAFMLSFSLGVGATTLVGQCVGAGEVVMARGVVRRILRVGLGLNMILGAVYLAIPESLMSAFVTEAQQASVLPYARPLFAIVAVCLALDLTYSVFWGALRGAGDTTFSMWANMASTWLLLVPGALLAAPRFGVVGAWSLLIVHFATMSFVLGWRFRGTAWQHGRAIDSRPDDEGGDADERAAGALAEEASV
jgi:MATE family multidrug resistance protein